MPADAFGDLAYRLESALGELHLEVDFSARNLRAAADELEQSNDAAKAALAASAVEASELNVRPSSSPLFSLSRGSDDG